MNAWLATRRAHDADDDGAMTAILLAGLRALWNRARPSLGEVTLAAIFQRAIHTAERRHHELEPLGLRVDERGVVSVTGACAPRVDLRGAVACVLAEVMRAISRLTADGLTRALHAALESATVDEPRSLGLLRSPNARCDSHERGAP